MRILYAYEYDASNPHTQSTRPFSILTEVKKKHDVVTYLSVPNLSRKLMAPRKLFYQAISRDHHLEREWLTLREYAWRVGRVLEATKPDIVFCPSQLIPTYLESSIPVIYCNDAPFGAMVDFYSFFDNISDLYREQGFRQEFESHRRASRIVYPSAWARQAAIEMHGADPEKCVEQSFGANLPYCPTWEFVQQTRASRDTQTVNLVLISSDWERKDGKFAVQVVERLASLGVNANLRVIGKGPSAEHERITSLGYVDKWTNDGADIFRKTLSTSHFIIMPSTAEAYGMSLWEGAAHGLPMIGRSVGGISSIVKHNETGMLFQPEAIPDTVAEWIQEALQPDTYMRLSEAAYADYATRGNWKVFVDKVFDL
tara:strand:+ start:12638 stop:13747 length:1110 start_codon:yes stop_codon:yes gene_type:complete